MSQNQIKKGTLVFPALLGNLPQKKSMWFFYGDNLQYFFRSFDGKNMCFKQWDKRNVEYSKENHIWYKNGERINEESK